MIFYRTIGCEAEDEFLERKSRFIGSIKPIQSEDEAINFINRKREEHASASHNVYAYCVQQGNRIRYSDDGEPQGTAGIPVLDVLKKNEVTDVVVVVTRYFGGILLGAGGLVRAYSHGAKLALDAGKIVTMGLFVKLELICEYAQYGKIAALIASLDGKIEEETFYDTVRVSFFILKDQVAFLNKNLSEITSGQVTAQRISESFLPIYDRK